MGIRIGENQITEITIRKHNNGYYTIVSKRLEDNSFDNSFVGIKFRKGVELEDRTRIRVIEGFLSFWRNKLETKEMITVTKRDGTTTEVEKKGDPHLEFMILDYEIIPRSERNNSQQDDTISDAEDTFVPISDDDLPFWF